jgi:hypothetical protein
MKRAAVPACLRHWAGGLLLAGACWAGTVSAQPAPAASATPAASSPQAPLPEASERQQLLQRLRDAQTRLSDLEHNIRELERQLAPAAAASEVTAVAAPAQPEQTSAVPLHWLWLGVLTVIVLMIGITYSGRRPAAKAPSATPEPRDEGLAGFQARLGTLDLSLDADARAPGHGTGHHRS